MSEKNTRAVRHADKLEALTPIVVLLAIRFPIMSSEGDRTRHSRN